MSGCWWGLGRQRGVTSHSDEARIATSRSCTKARQGLVPVTAFTKAGVVKTLREPACRCCDDRHRWWSRPCRFHRYVLHSQSAAACTWVQERARYQRTRAGLHTPGEKGHCVHCSVWLALLPPERHIEPLCTTAESEWWVADVGVCCANTASVLLW